LPTVRPTGREAPQPPVPHRASAEVERRRRELTLTATWLRELRGMAGGGAAAAGRFSRRYH
jgi:hypothetical protein